MKRILLRVASLTTWILLAIGCSSTRPAETPRDQGSSSPAEHKPGSLSSDDLVWLVGKWRTVTNTWVDPRRKLQGLDEHLLEWFNVYFPYADEDLTLRLTDNPEDRPIAAEFLIRPDPESLYQKAGLVPMVPTSIVRIGRNRIWVGGMFDLVEFKYKRVLDVAPPRLMLESKRVKIILEKTTDRAGEITNSWVVAPVRNYPATTIEMLQRKYGELRETQQHPKKS